MLLVLLVAMLLFIALIILIMMCTVRLMLMRASAKYVILDSENVVTHKPKVCTSSVIASASTDIVHAHTRLSLPHVDINMFGSWCFTLPLGGV